MEVDIEEYEEKLKKFFGRLEELGIKLFIDDIVYMEERDGKIEITYDGGIILKKEVLK